MPFSKPVQKQHVLLPCRKDFLRLQPDLKQNILKNLSVDNLIIYLEYIITGATHLPFKNGSIIMEQINEDNSRRDLFLDNSNMPLGDSFVLDWISKHANDRHVVELDPIDPTLANKRNENLMQFNQNEEEILKQNTPNFKIDHWKHIPLSSSSFNIPKSTNENSCLKDLDLNPKVERQFPTGNENINCNIPKIEKPKLFSEQSTTMDNNNFGMGINQVSKMFDAFHLPSHDQFNRMPSPEKRRLLNMLPKTVKDTYLLYGWKTLVNNNKNP